LQSVHSETYHASQPASQQSMLWTHGPTINPIELLKSMENTNPKNKTKQHKIIINQQTKQKKNNDAAAAPLQLLRSCKCKTSTNFAADFLP
jgi:hypothetical protein